MNAQTAKDYLPLVQALSEGKTIQESSEQQHYWSDVDDPVFSLPASRYRIKREQRRWWILFPEPGTTREYIYNREPQSIPCNIKEVVEVVEVINETKD